MKESDIKTTITNLKSRAELDRCDDCDNYTFVTIVKGREENGNRFSVGECVQCKKGLERLDGEKDVELMMEFRSKHWDAWVTFCLEHGYRPCVE